jgi:hypothetical protein
VAHTITDKYAPCEEFNRQLFKLIAGVEKLLEVVRYVVDSLLQEQISLIISEKLFQLTKESEHVCKERDENLPSPLPPNSY